MVKSSGSSRHHNGGIRGAALHLCCTSKMEKCGNPSCHKACGPERVCPLCRSVPYCSRKCQKAHYKTHKKICNSLNATNAQQLRHPDHLDVHEHLDDQILIDSLTKFSPFCLELWDLFKTAKKDKDTARIRTKMNFLAQRIDFPEKHIFLLKVIPFILRVKQWKLTQPTSIVLVLLSSGIDLSTYETTRCKLTLGTPFNTLSMMSSATDPHVNMNQVIVGRQLIEAGANVNLRSGEDDDTPLHVACSSTVPTNLDFVQLLLDNGADPNLTNSLGATPLMMTIKMSMPAAKFLLTYDYSKHDCSIPIDVNSGLLHGQTMLRATRGEIAYLEHQRAIKRLGLPSTAKGLWLKTASEDELSHLLQQMQEVEGLLVSLGGIDKRGGAKVDTTHPSSKPQQKPSSYMIDDLLDKDLADPTIAPAWYRQAEFYVDNHISRQFEIVEKRDHFHSCNGKRPLVGQKLQLSFTVPNTCSGRLAGEITETGPMPTERQLERSGSFLYGNRCSCSHPNCLITSTGKRIDILYMHGALHGQEVKGVVSLAPEYHGGKKECVHFFRGADTRYEVVLRCNDNMLGFFKSDIWELVRIKLLTNPSDETKILCAQGCGKPGKKKCSRCLEVHYCTSDCQRMHWRLHKLTCSKKSKEGKEK